MNNNQFEKIKRFLHFINNLEAKKPEEDGYDRLFKNRPLITSLIKKFLQVPLENCLFLDE